jgi:hypothetical protein
MMAPLPKTKRAKSGIMYGMAKMSLWGVTRAEKQVRAQRRKQR